MSDATQYDQDVEAVLRVLNGKPWHYAQTVLCAAMAEFCDTIAPAVGYTPQKYLANLHQMTRDVWAARRHD